MVNVEVVGTLWSMEILETHFKYMVHGVYMFQLLGPSIMGDTRSGEMPSPIPKKFGLTTDGWLMVKEGSVIMT